MLFAIGADVVSYERISRLWKAHAARLAETVFTKREIMPLKGRRTDLARREVLLLARLVAAKEATLKALRIPVGLAYELNEIEVRGTKRILVRLRGRLLKLAREVGIRRMVGNCCYSRTEALVLIRGEMSRG